MFAPTKKMVDGLIHSNIHPRKLGDGVCAQNGYAFLISVTYHVTCRKWHAAFALLLHLPVALLSVRMLCCHRGTSTAVEACFEHTQLVSCVCLFSTILYGYCMGRGSALMHTVAGMPAPTEVQRHAYTHADRHGTHSPCRVSCQLRMRACCGGLGEGCAGVNDTYNYCALMYDAYVQRSQTLWSVRLMKYTLHHMCGRCLCRGAVRGNTHLKMYASSCPLAGQPAIQLWELSLVALPALPLTVFVD